MVSEARKKHTFLISNWQIVITIFSSGLSRNLFCILHNIPTVVVITRRGHGCDFRIYVWLSVINLRIYAKIFFGIGW